LIGPGGKTLFYRIPDAHYGRAFTMGIPVAIYLPEKAKVGI